MVTVGSDNPYPSVLFVEGAAPTTPAANTQRLFVDTADGLLKLKDDAGVVTAIGGSATAHIADATAAHAASAVAFTPNGSIAATDVQAAIQEVRDEASAGGGAMATDVLWDVAGDLAVGTGANTGARLAKGAAGGALTMINGAVAWNSGTSFPGTPLTGDRYWRTDLGRECYYDGTQWLTVQEFSLPTTTRSVLGSGLAATLTSIVNAVVPGTSCYITTIRVVTFVNGSSTGTNKWTVEYYKLDAANVATSIGSFSTGTTPDTTVTWTVHDIVVNAAIASASFPVLRLDATKVASPGNLIFTWDLKYRLIIT